MNSLYGEPEPPGVTPRGAGINVAVYSAHASAIEFCLFESDRELRRVRLRGRTGDVFHDHIPDVPAGAHYGLRAHGPYSPRDGHRFNAAKLLLDPYAAAIDRPFAFHASMLDYRPEAPGDELTMDTTDSAPFVPKGIVAGAGSPPIGATRLSPWRKTVLYELHVRGFTAAHPGVTETLRGRFAGLAHPAAIDHLVRLGITTVEIMPAAAWIEERHLAAQALRNYWGYNPVTFMAPDPGLAPGGWDEIRAAIGALTAAGIEVVLDVVLNHTGEGDARGPTLSLRGLDNATYYRSLPGAPWRYSNETGCGNSLALDRPAPLRLAMDALRNWACQTGIHGFRFDLATTMGRGEAGFDPAAPLLSAIAQDPLLRDLKLIAEPWDVGPGGYRAGAFPAQWGEWNDRFRDDVRRFWRGDPAQRGALATRLAGSSDLFGHRHIASRSINFVTAHDGFTLNDLVSYTHKVNAANGEGNSDGTDENFSWNNGAEGPTNDAAIIVARLRDQRALLATLILARGTPMLSMGSELGHSQAGNNNAYAQDNAGSWLNWSIADEGLLAWTRRLLQIRRDFPVLRDDRFLTGQPVDVSLIPDVEWSNAVGEPIAPDAWQAADENILIVTLAEADVSGATTNRVCIVFHRGHVEAHVVLPRSRLGYRWHLIADSGVDDDTGVGIAGALDGRSDPPGSSHLTKDDGALTDIVTVAPRAVMVLGERRNERAAGNSPDPKLLARLALAASIAPLWWDVSGRRTVVSPDTKRALLASMRVPAGTEGEARDSLRAISEERDRRALPMALVSNVGEPAVLALGMESLLDRRASWLTIEQEDGEVRRIRIAPDDGELTTVSGLDGLPARVWRVGLPPLPMGRHRIRRDDSPDITCQLTVAPRRCFLPEPFRSGGRRFGISAQLYALRRRGDQGVGDFTTLARLAEAAAREGAAMIGINPLHMLYPEQRERASPYHPSDRRFLDPIYLDVGQDIGPDLQAGAFVAWSKVWAFKRTVLEQRFASFSAPEKAGHAAAEDFRQFIDRGGTALRRFAIFQAIAETRPGEYWRHWPAGLRSVDDFEVETFAHAHSERVRFHQYLQFLAEQQFAAAASTGLELGLFRDLAVGAAPDGAESWATSHDLADGAWIGAPPDPFAALGQNWHLPPPLPARYALDGFASFAGLVAANMRHAGALRIDHAMGLTRLFWVPDGGTGADGAYVAYPFAELLGQVALESVRARCMVVGEDLGTVPEGFRAVMSDADILSYRVLLLEREGGAFKPAASYPARAVACATTHDLPPLAGWWEGTDVTERAALAKSPGDPLGMEERTAERAALVDALVDAGSLARPTSGEPPVADVLQGVQDFVAITPSDLMLIQAEDLAGMRIGVNLPGTDTERPNWRLRVSAPIETLLTTPEAQAILRLVRARGRANGRAPTVPAEAAGEE